MGRFIEDRYEAEFVIERSVDEVWKSLEERSEQQPSWLSAWPNMEGTPSTGEVVELEAPYRVRVHKTSEPCKGTDIIVSLKEEANGTRVLVVQSGFPAYVKDALESFRIGGDQIIADLVLFLERGVTISRHAMPWAFVGLSASEVGAGLEVTGVMPGTFAEEAGLAPGDLLMTLGGAPVFTQLCLQAALRFLKSGETIEASWVRGRELKTGSATL